MIRCKVTSTKPPLLPISPRYTFHNFYNSQEHCITSAHMEKLNYFLGSQNQPSPCLNLESPLSTRRFTENTSPSLLKQSGSHGNHVSFWRSYSQKWLPEIDSVKCFSLQNGILIGTGNAFLCQRFRFARQVQHYRCDYWKFIWEVTRASRAVTFTATEKLKNVLKSQGSCLCKHWWTYPRCVYMQKRWQTCQYTCSHIACYTDLGCCFWVVQHFFCRKHPVLLVPESVTEQPP